MRKSFQRLFNLSDAIVSIKDPYRAVCTSAFKTNMLVVVFCETFLTTQTWRILSTRLKPGRFIFSAHVAVK